MTNIIKKENGQAPATFGSVVDQLFQNNLNRFFNDDFWGFNGITGRNQVPVNIRETDKSYEMEVIAPGVKKEDLKLNVVNDTLTVSFEHQEQNSQENKEESWMRNEYRLSSFTRSFNFDDTIDAGKITARYKDGILYVSLPKKEHAQRVSRAISIQ